MTEFTFESLNNYSYTSVLLHGHANIDGFRNDYVYSMLKPEYFGHNATRPPKEREDYLGRLKRFFGRKALLDVLSGKSYVCNAFEGDKIVATCLMDYPVDYRPNLSVWQHVKYYAYRAYFYVANYLDGNPQNEFMTPQLREFFGDMYKLAGAIQSPEYYEKLSEMNTSQLKDALYPADKTLYVHILAVCQDAQGHGYGGKLLKYSLSVFTEHIQVFKGSNYESKGPMKVSLYPTNNNDTFYQKFGFTVAAEADCQLNKEESFTHKFMQKVL